jgi:hypothetical protein
MSAQIIALNAFRRAAPAQTERLIALGNAEFARALGIIPAAAFVPLLGRLNDETRPFEMQLTDGE